VRKGSPLILSALLAGGCALPPLQQLPDCSYEARPTAEQVFTLPTLEEYAAGGTEIFSAPGRSSRLFISSGSYARELAGKRFKRLGEVSGGDDTYVQWLLEDCRLFYTLAGEK
jgi:hypothetical protein